MIDYSTLSPTTKLRLKSANIKSSLQGYTLEDLREYDNDGLKYAHMWADNVRGGNIIQAHGGRLSGVGLLLVGKPGHGKTTLASALAQELILTAPEEAWKSTPYEKSFTPVYFTDYPSLLRLQKRAFDDEASQRMVDSIFGENVNSEYNVRILILDDLGKEYRTASGWAENEFDALIRRRHSLGLPTIITTNVPLGKWSAMYGESMESFANEAFMTLDIVSPEGDRRLA
jgi:DNA replication protein DnaC